MFENLVSSYYAEEELDNALLNKIGECLHRAKAFMTYEEKQIGTVNSNAQIKQRHL